MSRLRGCPAASLSSVISACWMSVCLAALGGPGTSRRGTPCASRLPVCVPSGIPCPWLRGYREVFHLSAVEHILSSVSGGGACACPPVRLPPHSGEIRMSAFPQAVCPLNRVACFSGRRVSGGCPAVRQPGEIPAATNRVPGGLSLFCHLGLLDVRLPRSTWGPRHLAPGHPVRISPSCVRSLRHPVPVVAWLQGGVSFVGSRAYPFVCLGRWRVCVSASPAASPQWGNPDVCLPPGSVSPQPRGLFFGSSSFGRLSGCPAAWRNTGSN